MKLYRNRAKSTIEARSEPDQPTHLQKHIQEAKVFSSSRACIPDTVTDYNLLKGILAGQQAC